MKATYVGTITFSHNPDYNYVGLFGFAPGESMLGYAATLSFTYDPSLSVPPLRTTDTDYEAVTGGSSYPAPSPMLSVSVTVNGFTETVAGSYTASASTSAEPGNSGLWLEATSADAAFNRSVLAQAWDGPFANRLETPLPLTALASGSTNGNFMFSSCVGLNEDTGFCNHSEVVGHLTFESVEVSGIAPVPLPAGAALLASGLLGAGLLVRRQRREA